MKYGNIWIVGLGLNLERKQVKEEVEFRNKYMIKILDIK